MNESRSPTERRRHWRWSPMLHVAVVALHPLSVFLLPWRAGERDARMAIGLWRVDPVRRRGVLCALCYLSLCAVKVMISGFMLFLIGIIATRIWNLNAQPGVGWLGNAMTGIVSAVLLSAGGLVLLTFITSATAASIGQKIWIDEWPDPRTALDGRWPPVAARSPHRNIAGILGVVPSTMVPIAGVLFLVEPLNPLLLLISAMTGTIPAAWIARRIGALTPEECYPETGHPALVE